MACVAKSGEGASCGGYMPAFMMTRCDDGLECVYRNPMMADGGGDCARACKGGTTRDQWGNCIDAGCGSWFDGCNTCEVGARGAIFQRGPWGPPARYGPNLH